MHFPTHPLNNEQYIFRHTPSLKHQIRSPPTRLAPRVFIFFRHQRGVSQKPATNAAFPGASPLIFGMHSDQRVTLVPPILNSPT